MLEGAQVIKEPHADTKSAALGSINFQTYSEDASGGFQPPAVSHPNHDLRSSQLRLQSLEHTSHFHYTFFQFLIHRIHESNKMTVFSCYVWR